MKIYSEKSLQNFEFWSGARDTAYELTGQELDSIEETLESIYPDGMDETDINDIFWFEEDWIAKMLGYECWEHLEADHAGKEWPEPEEEEEEDEEETVYHDRNGNEYTEADLYEEYIDENGDEHYSYRLDDEGYVIPN